MTPTDSTRYGLVNQGGFFSPYYLFELLARQHGDELDPNGRSANRLPIRQLYRRVHARLGQGSSRSEAWQAWHRELLEALGFLPGPLQPLTVQLPTRHHGDVPISHAAYPANGNQLSVAGELSPLVYVDTHGFGVDLDHTRYGQHSRSPITAATTEEPIARAIELALDQGEARWAILLSGEEMRLYRKGGSVARQYLQVNFAPLFDADRDEEWVAFWGLFRYAAFVPGDDGKCLLDRVLEASQRHAARIADDLRENLILAMETIMQGILDDPANKPLLIPHLPAPYGTAVSDAGLRDLFEQTLYFLYRLLFVLYAESRDLLPVSESLVYRDGYSLEHLRDLAERPLPQAAATGTYFIETIRALLRMLQDGFPPPQSALNPGFTIDPFNGQLFDPARTHLLDQCRIPDRALHTAVAELSLSRPKKRKDRRERFSYADLGVDQLGSIYEGLLVYEPALATEETVLAKVKGEERLVTRTQADENNLPYDPASLKRPGQFILRLWGGRRKGSGSYYTPQEITSFLVKEALEPLTAPIVAGCGERDEHGRPRRHPDDMLQLKVCDPAMGSGAFLIQACRYLAEAYGQARMAAELDDDGRISQPEFAAHKRLVAERCLYGVDLNPMAVELAKVSLWLETLARGKPLDFLDAHLRCGNALIGAPLRDQQGQFTTRRLLTVPDEALKVVGKEATDLEKEAARERVKRNKEEVQRVQQQQAKSKTAGGQLPLGVGLDWGQYSLQAIEAALIDYQQARLIFEQTDQHLTTDEAVTLVHEKEQAFRQLQTAPDSKYLKVRQVCDLWCAIWFWPTTNVDFGDNPQSKNPPPPTTQTALELMAALLDTEEAVSLSTDEQTAYWNVVKQVWREQRFFHWELEFPEVWREKNAAPRKNGGFDALVGNPPWDTVKPNSQEFWSNYNPMFRELGKQEAIRFADELRQHPEIDALWQNYERNVGQTKHFYNQPDHFAHQGRGDVNTYKLFLERALFLMRFDGGLSLILPGGFYSDLGSKELRLMLFSECTVHYLLALVNERFIFSSVHHSFRFVLLTARRGQKTEQFQTLFRLTLDNAVASEVLPGLLADLETTTLKVPLEMIGRFSPDSLSIMEFNSQREIDLATAVYANHPLLGELPGKSWAVQFTREYDMTNHSPLFREEAWLRTNGFVSHGNQWQKGNQVYYPLHEGKTMHQYQVAYEKHRYWLAKQDVFKRTNTSPKLAYRLVARSTDEMTLIATILPPMAPTGHSLAVQVATNAPTDAQQTFACACLNSLPLNYILRQRVQANISMFVIAQLPLPRLDTGNFHFDALVKRGTVLANESGEMAHRAQLRGEIEALVADLYGLSASDFAYILTTFPLLDRDMPALAGEPKSTITRDLALLALHRLRRQPPPPDIVPFFAAAGANISDITGPIRALAARVHEACKLGAVAYIPSGRGAPIAPAEALRQLNLFTEDTV